MPSHFLYAFSVQLICLPPFVMHQSLSKSVNSLVKIPEQTDGWVAHWLERKGANFPLPRVGLTLGFFVLTMWRPCYNLAVISSLFENYRIDLALLLGSTASVNSNGKTCLVKATGKRHSSPRESSWEQLHLSSMASSMLTLTLPQRAVVSGSFWIFVSDSLSRSGYVFFKHGAWTSSG